MRTIIKIQASLGFAKVFSANISKSQFRQIFLPPKFCTIQYYRPKYIHAYSTVGPYRPHMIVCLMLRQLLSYYKSCTNKGTINMLLENLHVLRILSLCLTIVALVQPIQLHPSLSATYITQEHVNICM